MMRKNKRASFGTASIGFLAAATVLFAGSAVGSTRAALSIYSDDYLAQIEVPTIDVALNENGKTVEGDGTLLTDITENISIGKKYDEVLTVSNTGEIDTYVRVRVYRSWVDENNKPIMTMAPELIDINFVTGNGWVIAPESEESEERTMLYYTKPLAPGASTSEFADSFTIDNAVLTKIGSDNSGAARYMYNGADFKLEVEVDSVQIVGGREAVVSAWGRDVTIHEDGSLSLMNQE